jgi:uncharacterized membrane protein YeaQ/YmgE (transglycosylase-associated protein family)
MTRRRRGATTLFDTPVALRCVAAVTAARRRRNASTVQRFNAATSHFKTIFLAEEPPVRYNSPNMDFSAHSIIWTLFIGLVIGAIAKLLMPGKDPGGCIVTILLGIAGAFVGTWIGRIFAGGNYVAGWIMSIVGAMILLLLYRLLFKRGV